MSIFFWNYIPLSFLRTRAFSKKKSLVFHYMQRVMANKKTRKICQIICLVVLRNNNKLLFDHFILKANFQNQSNFTFICQKKKIIFAKRLHLYFD